ncbi:MAG: response regulator transcription factor [Thermoleophilia bacterium]|nr:response regulator transcription factor [Thermoleophilia bacterium]
MKVLVIVEDDLQMQLLIRMNIELDDRLELSGAATNAAEAIEVARAEQPDLIILDHFIDGDVMGLHAAPALKEAAPSAKVLLFTSHDLRLEARREPAIDRYLGKTDITALLGTVQEMLDLDPPVASGR